MAAHARDPAAEFAEAFHANYADVLGYVSRRIREPKAEDITAEVFKRAWQAWHRAPLEHRPWLFGIARNLIVDSYRAQQREAKLTSAMHDAAAPVAYEMDPTTSVDLQNAWAKLPIADKEALTLVAWEGLTGAQAATVLGCTRAAFSVRLTRARRRLKSLLAVQPLVGQPHPHKAPTDRNSRSVHNQREFFGSDRLTDDGRAPDLTAVDIPNQSTRQPNSPFGQDPDRSKPCLIIKATSTFPIPSFGA